jgi:imidazolonepropionase-like amidohydrolase
MTTMATDHRTEFECHVRQSPRPTLCLKVGGILSFEGDSLQQQGASLLFIENEHVLSVIPASEIPEDWRQILNAAHPHTATFDFSHCIAAPGLVEGHAHLFLSPDNDPVTTEQELYDRASSNAVMALRQGTMWVRDCGDPQGINLRVRNRAKSYTSPAPRIRACGAAIHKRKRYGKQLGIAVETDKDLLTAANERIAAGADDVKLILSGIVNFDKADVPGEPQFSIDAVRDVVNFAHDRGCRVVAHASGCSGTAAAAAAGVDSIEHAYFVSDETLAMMVEKRTAWLPTIAPVHVQWRDSERYGHSSATKDNLRRILDGHARRIVRGSEMGVRIVGGSDSGSPGVGHGSGIAEEFNLLAEAGLNRERAYAACSSPGARSLGFAQGHFNCQLGSSADFVLLSTSPIEDPACFKSPRAIVRNGRLFSFVHDTAGGEA